MSTEQNQPTIESLQAEIASLRRQLDVCAGIIRDMPLGVHVFKLEDLDDDRTLRVIMTNPAAAKLSNQTMEDMLGKTIDEMYPTVRKAGIPEAFAQAIRTGEPLVMEHIVHGEDRSVQVAILVRGTPLPEQRLSVIFENITERKQAEATLQERETRLRMLVSNAPIVMFAVDTEGKITLIEGRALDSIGQRAEDMVGNSVYELYHDFPQVLAAIRQALSGEASNSVSELNGVTFETSYTPIRNSEGDVTGLIGIGTDVTARKRAEEALRQSVAQEEIINAQAAALRELSTPLIPLADNVVVMPLVGSLDSRRSQQITETLLEGIVQHQADVAILDITGVPVVDTQVADALLRTARAVKLLGAQVVLTGIGGGVAQSLVHLGADLRDIVTLNNLQSGIAYALERR